MNNKGYGMSCFFPKFDHNFKKYFKIFLVCLAIFVTAILSGCKAIKSVGSFFTSTGKNAAETTEKIIGTIPSGIPVEVEHNFTLEPVLLIAIIILGLAIGVRYLVNRHVNNKKIVKK